MEADPDASVDGRDGTAGGADELEDVGAATAVADDIVDDEDWGADDDAAAAAGAGPAGAGAGAEEGKGAADGTETT